MAEQNSDVASAVAQSSVSASSSIDFVVVDHVDDLRNQQKVLSDTINGLLLRIASLDHKTNMMGDTSRVLDYYWRIYCSLLLTICPVLLAFIIDYKTRDSLYPMDLPSSLVQILVGFTICVGLPMFAFHMFELLEMREGLSRMDDDDDDDDDEWKTTDDELEEVDADIGDEDAMEPFDYSIVGDDVAGPLLEPTVVETIVPGDKCGMHGDQ